MIDGAIIDDGIHRLAAGGYVSNFIHHLAVVATSQVHRLATMATSQICRGGN